MKVAVIGLGTMGWRIAKNFATEGILGGIWNRTEGKAKLFSSQFGVKILNLSNLEGIDFIILSLSDDEAVSSVLERLDVKSKVVIDTSTISPRTSIRLARQVMERGGVMYDAPITGSTGIEQRKATVMVGGPEERKEEVISLLRRTANRVIYVGGNGAGLYLKLVNNLIAGTYMLALAEGFSLAEKAGLDLGLVSSFLSEGSIVSSPLSSLKSPMLRDRKYETQFRLSLMAKDLRIINRECESLSVVNLLSSLASKLFDAASTSGLGEMDMASVYEFLRKL